jgi:hypothetical protein
MFTYIHKWLCTPAGSGSASTGGLFEYAVSAAGKLADAVTGGLRSIGGSTGLLATAGSSTSSLVAATSTADVKFVGVVEREEDTAFSSGSNSSLDPPTNGSA